MDKETVLRLAKDAGWPSLTIMMIDGTEDEKRLMRFAALVAAHEREECAKFFDMNDDNLFWGSQASGHIRLRGQA